MFYFWVSLEASELLSHLEPEAVGPYVNSKLDETCIQIQTQ